MLNQSDEPLQKQYLETLTMLRQCRSKHANELGVRTEQSNSFQWNSEVSLGHVIVDYGGDVVYNDFGFTGHHPRQVNITDVFLFCSFKNSLKRKEKKGNGDNIDIFRADTHANMAAKKKKSGKKKK